MYQRKAIESIERQKHQMIAAIWSNPNWDGQENADKRNEFIRELEDKFNHAIKLVYESDTATARGEEEIDWSHPFYAAVRRSYASKGIKIEEAEMQEARQKIEGNFDNEQMRAREQSRRDIDQL